MTSHIGDNPEEIKRIIQHYRATLTRNRLALPARAKTLNKAIKDPALIAGGGRILSALVEAGLDLSLFDGIIDPYLPLLEIHGLPIFGPEMYGTVKPRTVLVCSRNEGLVAEARLGWPGVEEIILWNG